MDLSRLDRKLMQFGFEDAPPRVLCTFAERHQSEEYLAGSILRRRTDPG